MKRQSMVASVVALLALATGILAQRNHQHSPSPQPSQSVAFSQSPSPLPTVRAYALTEDITSLPAEFASYTSIDRTALDTTFAAPASASEDALFLFVSQELLLSSTESGDPFLYDRLWSSVLGRGHGVFVFDASSNEVANTLDLEIPRADDSDAWDHGVQHIGVGVQKYRISAIGGEPCPPSVGFATFSFVSQRVVADESTGVLSYEGPSYGEAHALTAMLAAETIDEDISESAQMSSKANLDGPVTIAGTVAVINENKFGLFSGGTVHHHQCAWGVSGWITKVYGTTQSEECDWRPVCLVPEKCPPAEMMWGVQAGQFTWGSGHFWRPDDLGGWNPVGDVCNTSEEAVLAYSQQDRLSWGGDWDILTRLDDTDPDNSIYENGSQDVTVGAGLPAGVYGEGTWSFSLHDVDLITSSNVGLEPGNSWWQRKLFMGILMEGAECDTTDPPSRNALLNARGTAGHLTMMSTPGETWAVLDLDGGEVEDEFAMELEYRIDGHGLRKALVPGFPDRRMSACTVSPRFQYRFPMTPSGRIGILMPCPPDIPGPYRDPGADLYPTATPTPFGAETTPTLATSP